MTHLRRVETRFVSMGLVEGSLVRWAGGKVMVASTSVSASSISSASFRVLGRGNGGWRRLMNAMLPDGFGALLATVKTQISTGRVFPARTGMQLAVDLLSVRNSQFAKFEAAVGDDVAADVVVGGAHPPVAVSVNP